MKILFVGDASNFHNTLSDALMALGDSCVVVSDGSRWMDTPRDINIKRGKGGLGTVRYLFDIVRNLHRMRGFDVVHISNPIFFNLKPNKVRKIFDYLKRHNGAIYLSALGTDSYYVESCLDGKEFRYSDFMIGNQPSPYAKEHPEIAKAWQSPLLAEHTRYIADNVDGIITCLYEYYQAYKPSHANKLYYAGIPIDTALNAPTIPITETPYKVRFFIGIQRDRSSLKGTNIMLKALQRVVAKHPNHSEIVIAENVPYSQYCAMMNSSHVILDQLYSYTPATNALLAMSRGLIAISGAEPEYYAFIKENQNQPIVNVTPFNNIEEQIEYLINNRDKIPALSQQSREFVIKHNDAELIAKKHLEIWQNCKC
ncbi:MAG: glycosyltransferase family 1 protein [Bacteroidales bacterium]